MQQTMRERRMDCYVVGAANAGKSSFLNRCLNHFAAKKGTGSVKRPGSANKNLVRDRVRVRVRIRVRVRVRVRARVRVRVRVRVSS